MEVQICTPTFVQYSFVFLFFVFVFVFFFWGGGAYNYKGYFSKKKWKFHHSVLPCFLQKHTCTYITHKFLQATLKLQFSSLTMH